MQPPPFIGQGLNQDVAKTGRKVTADNILNFFKYQCSYFHNCRLHHCKLKDWQHYGTITDLAEEPPFSPSQTNISNSSPTFSFDAIVSNQKQPNALDLNQDQAISGTPTLNQQNSELLSQDQATSSTPTKNQNSVVLNQDQEISGTPNQNHQNSIFSNQDQAIPSSTPTQSQNSVVFNQDQATCESPTQNHQNSVVLAQDQPCGVVLTQGLSDTCKWKQTYMRAHHLDRNWATGRYRVAPLLRGHKERVTCIDCDGEFL